MSKLKQTALYEEHRKAGAKIVPFYGWSMPLHYGSQLKEHQQVRLQLGVFDVSHMTLIDITGADRRVFLARLLANDVGELRVLGQAQYTLLLREDGGILDDLIVYFMSDRYRLVVNCGTREKVLSWLQQNTENNDIDIRERQDLSMLAIQGPQARDQVARVLGQEAQTLIGELLPFTSAAQANWQIARTGYTGEDGLEIILPNAEAVDLWRRLLAAGIAPIGLGARDTLRLEAGLNLYGQDMDETVNPFESRLGWTVAMKDDRDFIGRAALKSAKDIGIDKALIGVVYSGKGILRQGNLVQQSGKTIGKLTSGSYAPSLGVSVGLARVEGLIDEPLSVQLRQHWVTVDAVKPPFYKSGKAQIKPLFD